MPYEAMPVADGIAVKHWTRPIATTLAFPYWHQRGYLEGNPPPV
jgi:hypothetical protein